MLRLHLSPLICVIFITFLKYLLYPSKVGIKQTANNLSIHYYYRLFIRLSILSEAP